MLNKKRKIEIFTAGCQICEPTVELVKKTACPSCEVVIYDLKEGCASNECRTLAQKYGVKRLPTVVVNGKLLDCCTAGAVSQTQVSEQSLRAAGVGQP